MKLNEMGTTGLIDYLKGITYKGRSYGLVKSTVKRIIVKRHGENVWPLFLRNL